MFTLALREGMGFAYACYVSGNDPEEISETIKKNKEAKRQLEQIVRASNIDLLRVHSEYIKNNDFEKAVAIEQKAKTIAKLVLWGDLGVWDEKDDEDIAMLYMQYGSGYTVACGLGISYEDWCMEMALRPAIELVVSKLQKLK